MDRGKTVKRIGIAADILMYLLLTAQLLCVFVGVTVHEFLGMGFFACLVCHIVIKRKVILAMFRKRSTKRSGARLFSDTVTVLLLLCCVTLMLSSMGVSRIIFPWFRYVQSVSLHRYLACAALTLAVIHGGMRGYMRAKKKKRAGVLIALGAVAALSFGLFGVPYLDRHFKKVEIDYAGKVSGDKLDWQGGRTLTVYFTRLGNTDFEADVDAVSGASLLLADGRLMGNTQLLADMLCDIAGFDKTAITLTGKKYPSSYASTVFAASEEIKSNARPPIEPIDTSDCDQIILVYPLWWGTVPNPVATFLEQSSLGGKKIYLIATQGSYGFGSSADDIRELVPDAEVEEVMSIYCDDIPDSRQRLKDWLESINTAK
ncbi:MAG: hypothetical protein IKP47_02240 [Ruminococcus sp.]|nr:hypothetical protein [Ruminococcus sp.]